MILIRNLRGKTGKDSWVQVMATQAGSAWIFFLKWIHSLTLFAAKKTELGSLNPNVYKIIWMAYLVKNNLLECQKPKKSYICLTWQIFWQSSGVSTPSVTEVASFNQTSHHLLSFVQKPIIMSMLRIARHDQSDKIFEWLVMQRF